MEAIVHLFQGPVQVFSWRECVNRKGPQLGFLVCSPRFESGTPEYEAGMFDYDVRFSF
jgi:hypothetical protein